MKYIVVFLINLLALNFWLWLFQNIFQRKHKKRLIFLLVIAMGIISSGAMLLYPWILQQLDITSFGIESLTRQNIMLLISYVWVIWILLALFWQKISFWQKIFVRGIAFIGLAVWIAIGLVSLPTGILLYFLCVAGAEEFLKLSVSQSFFAQYRISKKDLIVFAILSAIWFALIENIIYLFRDPSIGLAISRNLTTVIMHVLFTGTIAFIISKQSGNNRWRYILAFLLGMALHRGYNTFISYNNPLITICVIIVWYFAVSYFLYKSDRLYLSK